MRSAATIPATIAAALEPRPPTSGICERIANETPSAGCSRSNALTARFLRPCATGRSVVSSKASARCTSSSRCIPSAAAKLSKPGPRFAEEAGTRTRRPPLRRSFKIGGAVGACMDQAGRRGTAQRVLVACASRRVVIQRRVHVRILA